MSRHLRLLRGICIALVVLLNSPLIAQKDLSSQKAKLARDPRVTQFEFSPQRATLSYVSFHHKQGPKAEQAKELIREFFSLDPTHHEINTLRKDQLRSGVSVERFRMQYRGIPVVHSSYIVNSKEGRILSIHAESYELDPSFSVTPALTSATALEKALAFVNAKKYAWQALEEDKALVKDDPVMLEKLESLRREHEPTGELVIAKDVYGNGKPRLAWRFNIYAVDPLSRSYVFIDAQDGRLLLRDMIIKHAGKEKKQPEFPRQGKGMQKRIMAGQVTAPTVGIPENPRVTASELGVAHTRYAGVRNIYTTRVTVPLLGMPDPNNPSVLLSYSGVDPRQTILLAEQVFILKDDTRGLGVETYDMNGAGGLPLSIPALQSQALAFVDRNVLAGSQNIWRNEAAPGTNEDHVRGATSNGTVGADEAANDDFALDAHWGAEMVYDYWLARHGRLSFDNKNSAIKSYVHYGPAYDNAFWNGSVMTYGDGSGTTALGFRPLTSLDVCGHEIGHGVCSFTSDLVYASESGAMNEALSDIWAAAVENFVKTTVDPTLTYHEFQIGEQIAADNVGLRRMDNPPNNSNPDTYGGTNWQNPNCTPNLANDECGVHTNSGVLNKWFYLLVKGPLQTTGSPAYTDDGINDNGQNYGILGNWGIGFLKAEAITYLMELNLTPTATHAEARIASINAARILYGECSLEEIAVTQSWYAVGVGAAYTSCALPTISAYSLITDVRETAAGTDCDRFTEYNINVNLTVSQPAPVTVNVSVGATTLSADEYSLSASSVSYNTGETGLRTVKLRIYDDAMVESDETITIDVSCSSPAMNTSIMFTVRNDDVDPVIGSTITLLNENFEAVTEGAYGAPTVNTWGKIDKIPGNVQWSVRTDGAAPGPISFTTKRAIIEISAPVAIPGEALYDQLANAHSILRAPRIDATGRNSIRVQFTYQAGGEPACDPACDYGRLVYSFDGNNFFGFGDLDPLFLTLTDAAFDYTLPASFNGKQFYLGIEWYNDPNAGTSGSVTIDDFVVTARGRDIESELNDQVSEKVNAETGKPSYFYSVADGELLARVSSSTAHNYGCMSVSLEKAGNSAFELYVSGTDHHRVGDKVYRVTPTTNNVTGTYSITLYLTEAEIAAIEAFTGLDRTTFYIYKTSAANYTGANASNTVRQSATYTAIPGVGGSFSASFNTGFSGFAIGASVSIVLPVNCVDFRAVKNGSMVRLNWKVAEETNNAGFEIERSADGVNYNLVGSVNADPASGGHYSYNDANIAGLERVFYRLKQKDINGAIRSICTILKLELTRPGLIVGPIHPNPGKESWVNVETSAMLNLRMEFINAIGEMVKIQQVQVLPGATRIDLNIGDQASGTYQVRFRDGNGNLLSSQTYVKLR